MNKKMKKIDKKDRKKGIKKNGNIGIKEPYVFSDV